MSFSVKDKAGEEDASSVSISEASTRYLRRLVGSASDYLGKKVTSAVISVPTNFNDKPEIAQYFLSAAGMLEESNGESGLNDAAASIELADGDEVKKDGSGPSESTA